VFKETSNAEIEASKSEDTGMVLKSVSSVCLTKTGKTSSQAPSEPESKKSSRNSSKTDN
jgi:hypothetical protein